MNTLRIPTKEAYAYMEVQYDGSPDEAFAEYKRLTDLIQGNEGEYTKIQTFTGETVLYNDDTHSYKTLDGKKLVSGSAYKKSLEAPFPKDMARKMGEKYEIPEKDVSDMWKLNSEVSTNFGTALHKGMELYRRFKNHKNEKDYFLAKNPAIKDIVLAFPELDSDGHSEIMVSDIKNLRVGQIDWLHILGENKGIVDDYKSDADIKKNLNGHFNQLSFYAHILIAHGWEIEKVRIWNWDFAEAKWVVYESPVLALTN